MRCNRWCRTQNWYTYLNLKVFLVFLFFYIFEFCHVSFSVRINNEKSNRIYLYTFVISDEGFQIPIYSMISEVHNASVISYWFLEFIRMFDDIPNVFVCDISFALLNAAARTFGSSDDIWNYIETLFKMHTSINEVKKPKCFIQIDRAHLINNVRTCNALSKSSFIVRNFYIRSVCLMLQATSLNQAELILKSVLTVAYAMYEGKYY